MQTFKYATTAALLLTMGLTVQGHENDPKRNPEPAILGEIVRGGADGVAGIYPTENVTFYSQVPINQLGGSGNGSDCWGYTSPSGREYALVTTETSLAVVEVTSPTNPNVIFTYSRGGTSSLWGDVKVVGEYCYMVGEGGGSIWTFDLTDADNGNVSFVGEAASNGGTATHNIASCPEANLLARCGGGNSGLRWYSTDNPANPSYLGEFSDIYVHDAQIALYPQTAPDTTYRGHIIGFLNGGNNGGSTNTSLWVVDFGTPTNFNPSGTVLDTVTWPGAGYSHQGWADDNFNFYWSNDETALNYTHQLIDIEDLNNIDFIASLSNGSASSVNHNNYWHEGLLYAANYTSGIRIFETLATGQINEVAYIDTYPANDGASFNGAWSVFPYFESGTVIASDFQSGLIVFGVDISPVGISYPSGIPSSVASSGGPIDIDVSLDGSIVVDEVRMDYSLSSGASGQVIASANGSGSYTAILPGTTDCPDIASVSFEVVLTNGEVYPDNGGPYQIAMNDGSEILAAWNGDAQAGWSFGDAGDNAIDGQWGRGFPAGIGDRGDPATDCDGSGQCFLTDNEFGNSDVDDGITSLLSPIFDATGIDGVQVGYCRWYSNDAGADPNNDSMPIEISNNAGVSWVLLEDVSENAGAWVDRTFQISDFVTPTSSMQLRFTARDLNAGSVIEAGVDNVRVFGTVCDTTPGPPPCDINNDGTVNGGDLGILLSAFNTDNELADLDQSGTVDGGDIGLLLACWTG